MLLHGKNWRGSGLATSRFPEGATITTLTHYVWTPVSIPIAASELEVLAAKRFCDFDVRWRDGTDGASTVEVLCDVPERANLARGVLEVAIRDARERHDINATHADQIALRVAELIWPAGGTFDVVRDRHPAL